MKIPVKTKTARRTVDNLSTIEIEVIRMGKYVKPIVPMSKDLLRIIQSIPSPKAEPFKLWLAKVGYERIQDMADPARSLDRAREYWQQHGRSEKWIQQSMMGKETRNKLTDYWKDHEINKRRRIRNSDQYHPSGMDRLQN